MGTAAKKKRPMRSIRSGIKKIQLVKSNWDILKKLGFFSLVLSFIFTSCIPVRYVFIDPKDSTVREQRVIQNDVYLHTPLYFNYYRPYYIPSPRIVVPVRPSYRPMPRGKH